jgi:small-conductance mechanosensitive channel
MNGKRIIILVSALIVSALIVWHDLPIEFPSIMFKMVMLFVKLFIVLAVASFAYVFAGRKKKSS